MAHACGSAATTAGGTQYLLFTGTGKEFRRDQDRSVFRPARRRQRPIVLLSPDLPPPMEPVSTNGGALPDAAPNLVRVGLLAMQGR